MAVLAMTNKIPEDLKVDQQILQRLKLVLPHVDTKKCDVVVKIESEKAFNPNPVEVDYKIKIINNKAEKMARDNFLQALADSVPGVDTVTIDALKKHASELAAQEEKRYLAHM